MNPVRKRLKLDYGSTRTVSHDAPLQPSGPAASGGGARCIGGGVPCDGGGATDEEEGFLLVEEDTTDSSLIITMDETKVKTRKRKRKQTDEDEGGGASESEPEIDRQLDQSLETKSKQHNLTTVNVKNILHEVITNEHVVAMMKAAINDTEALPPFEPKMTRSKLKEVVEKGVVIPAWNISPIKKQNELHKPPQFVDMTLADEDSSDEEYRPDEDEEDETAEDTFQESDLESTASSPRGSRLRDESSSPWQTSRSRSRCQRAGSVSMGPPPPPKATPTRHVSDSPRATPTWGLIDSSRGRTIVSDSAFLEKLHAVEEELSVCIQPFQPLQDSDLDLMAGRTRSKRPLRDVPLGRLEAELRAPDFTPDLYDSGPSHEDRDWTNWLRGLMCSDLEEEGDDEDDPEYNFLADLDEPDLEDYRDDKAVRITKKEVNELMEELFETLKEDLASQEQDEEGHEEEEEAPAENHIGQQLSQSSGVCVAETEPVAELRTVRQQLEFLRKHPRFRTLENTEAVSLFLNAAQRRRLHQQLQQHVQLLTQIHLLTSPIAKLHSEAQTTKQFLVELDFLAQRAELMMSSCGCHGYSSVFRACNLQGALQLLQETRLNPIHYRPLPQPPDKRVRSFPVLPAELAWIFATRPVFLYPELLPCANLDPDLYCPRRTSAFTAAEDCLLVLGLRNMEDSSDPVKLVSEFLLRKTLVQVRRRILQCCRPGNPDNIVKAFRFQRVLWPMPVACVPQTEQRPSVERQERCMPLWLTRSLPVLHAFLRRLNSEAPPSSHQPRPRSSQLTLLRSDWSGPFPPGTLFPPRLPKDQLDFKRIGFVLLHPRPENGPIREQQEENGPIRKQEEENGPIREQKEENGPIRCPTQEEEEEDECDVVLALSESSPSNSPSLSNREPELMDTDSISYEPLGQTETEQDCISHRAPGQRTESNVRDAQKVAVVGAKNVCVSSNGKRVVVWTREADRVLLLAVQQRGANRKTFRHISTQLGNKTTAQVGLRFRDLMTLFHSANHRAPSCPSQEPISR